MTSSLQSQMTWHQGRALSQTVHTILYVHQLQDLDPLQWYRHQEVAPGQTRPGNLMVQVLNSCIVGLLKCCDLVWREFSQRHVYEVCTLSSLDTLNKLPLEP